MWVGCPDLIWLALIKHKNITTMKEGDIVILKSGGPLMTINILRPSGLHECTYWNPYNHSFENKDIKEYCLIVANQFYSPIYYSEEIETKSRFHHRNNG